MTRSMFFFFFFCWRFLRFLLKAIEQNYYLTIIEDKKRAQRNRPYCALFIGCYG